MFGLNPAVLYLIVGLVVTNVLTGVAWQIEKHSAAAEKERVVACKAEFSAFEHQVEALGKQQEKKVAEVIASSKTITKQTESRYETRLAAMRADYDRLRQQYTRAGGGAVSAVPVAAVRADGIPADCMALAEQSAETTLMLVELQHWIEEQQEAHRD